MLEGRRSNNTLLKWGREGSAALGVARCLALLQLRCGDAVGRLCPPFCSTGVIFFLTEWLMDVSQLTGLLHLFCSFQFILY